MNRYQAIKLLSSKEVFDTFTDDELYDQGGYLTIYDILDKLDVERKEIDFTEGLSFTELGLLD